MELENGDETEIKNDGRWQATSREQQTIQSFRHTGRRRLYTALGLGLGTWCAHYSYGPEWALLARAGRPGPDACSVKSLQVNESQDPLINLRADCTVMLPTPQGRAQALGLVWKFENRTGLERLKLFSYLKLNKEKILVSPILSSFVTTKLALISKY